MTNAKFQLLDAIESPADLRQLAQKDLTHLAYELRQFIIDTMSVYGGHFAANLGTVELAIALHYIYQTPNDRLIWDVGHQAYPHKILTGRRDCLHTIRKSGGLSPFPKRSESEYDTFGVGHSSTSISAALGMAIAADRQHSDRKVCAIIGDGAMTAGMAYEALNHGGHTKSDLLVILNDNEMSISPNVGGLSNYLGKILASKPYSHLRQRSQQVFSRIPPIWDLAKRAEERVKGIFVPGALFEEMGFNYSGPIDGHDLSVLIATLANLRNSKGPQLLHIVTRKGKGFAPAEKDPIKYHGVGKFDPLTGEMPVSQPSSPTYTQVFSDWICQAAQDDSRIVAITPAMREGSGLVEFEKRFPGRYFDVGIAEQHSVTLAAGLACEDMKPVVAIYSTFLQRAYDQTIHDVALQNLPVVFAIDRAGLVGPDGPTHAGSFDFTYLRCIPNMVIMAPADENECRDMLHTAIQLDQPVAVRYPRGKGPGVAVQKTAKTLTVGQAEQHRKGKKIAIFSFGAVLQPALETAEILDATVVNMRFVKPLDEKMVSTIAAQHDYLISIEDNMSAGGAGSAITQFLSQSTATLRPTLILGLPDRVGEHGERTELLSQCGLDAAGIQSQIQTWLADQKPAKQRKKKGDKTT